MAPLGLVALAAISATSVAACKANLPSLEAEASQRFGVSIALIDRVVRVESGGCSTKAGPFAVSSAGAIGLMQLMPRTWQELRVALALGASAYDMHDNIMAGSLYLAKLQSAFGYPGALAAYNAGPARYLAFLRGQRSLPAETAAYVLKFGETPFGRLGPSKLARSIFIDPVGAAPKFGPTQDLLFVWRD